MTRYKSINELHAFSFHDAAIENISFCEGRMIWLVSSLNATSQNSQNAQSIDQCIKEAEMVFSYAKVAEIEFWGWSIHDNKGNLVEKVAPRKAVESEFSDIMEKTVACGWAHFFSMESLEKQGEIHTVCFSIDGGAGMYNMTMEFRDVVVTWNDYSGPAWYEKPPFKKG